MRRFECTEHGEEAGWRFGVSCDATHGAATDVTPSLRGAAIPREKMTDDAISIDGRMPVAEFFLVPLS